MCPSVWLTLDILAGRKDGNGGQSATGISQHIGSWLDKLKANRSGRMDGGGSGDEYQNNVHFALEPNNAGSGGGGSAAVEPPNLDFNGEEVPVNNKRRKKKKGIRKETPRGKKKAAREALAMVEEEVKPLVDCSFDLPKVQVGCQRLMGTNVVRLTDKSFMQELRRRIKEDYNAILQKRIAVREAKEIERERTLAISNRTGCIPQTLAGKPVNLSYKQSSDLAKSRAKLKTKRERNAEKLVRQSIKWERERLISYELEKRKLLEAQQRREEELMIDRGDRAAARQYLHPNSAAAARGRSMDHGLTKTQVEDSPATDNKTVSIRDTVLAGEERDQETDDGESDDLIHDDDEAAADGDYGRRVAVNGKVGKHNPSASSDSEGGKRHENEKLIESVGDKDDGSDSGSDGATRRSLAKASNPAVDELQANARNPVNTIILTEDGIMNRLLAAETVEQLYVIAEEIIGKTKVKRIKHLLST